MLKKALTILFLAAFFLQTFQQGLLFTGFFARQSYIAQNLCENKSRPAMHCNGKCQLMKKLKAEQNKDRENPGRRADNKQEILPGHNPNPEIVSIAQATSARHGRIFGSKPVDRSFALFRPPGNC